MCDVNHFYLIACKNSHLGISSYITMIHTEADIVLVSSPVTQKDSQYPFLGTRTTYLDALIVSKFLPVIVGPNMDQQTLMRLYKRAAAVVLTGGGDWNPSVYGQKARIETQVPDDDRDAFELMLLLLALQDKKPILGICRGEQGLAIAAQQLYAPELFASILIQHLPNITQVTHHVATYEELTTNIHDVTVLPNTQLSTMLPHHLTVASGHHQAVNPKALIALPELKVSAVSRQDNVIEAIEVDEHVHPFAIGTQFHIELDPKSCTALLDMLFVEALRFSVNQRLQYPSAHVSNTSSR